VTARKLARVDLSWHWRAACHEDNRPPDVRPEWFDRLSYRPRGRYADVPTVKRALEVCAQCPVVEQCRQQADSDPGAGGVWAGQYRR
jgi:hypothetical protein